MSPPSASPSGASGPALTTDFELMLAVAGRTDVRNDEIRAMLQSFIGAMCSVPPSVWGGAAAVRFREVVERWNTESLRLHAALQRIADTIRDNERILRTATDGHADHIGSVATTI
ncbi:MAG: WXG100 family type VII secretion target [Actinomycetota bacterium]|nr:WXG100 family type VII secretion target [Actinomycetota bacterium]